MMTHCPLYYTLCLPIKKASSYKKKKLISHKPASYQAFSFGSSCLCLFPVSILSSLTLFLVQIILVSFSFWKASCSPSPEVFASAAHPHPLYGTILILVTLLHPIDLRWKVTSRRRPCLIPQTRWNLLVHAVLCILPFLLELPSHLSGYRSNRCLFYTASMGLSVFPRTRKRPMQGSGRKKLQKNCTSSIIKFYLMVYFRGQANSAQSPMHGSIGVGECSGYHFFSPEMGQVLWWHSVDRGGTML